MRFLLESSLLEEFLNRTAQTPDALPLLARLGLVRRERRPTPPGNDDAGEEPWTWHEVAAAVISWAVPYSDLPSFSRAIAERRALLAEMRRDDAPLSFATAHATKGLEFDHVAVIGLETGRFPSRRTLEESPEPGRALEEERRLAYVAWTRARRTLTLIYDPAAPSPFLLEAFDAAELERAAAVVGARISA
jgi:DNA helicase-2/ATP-dependent DNA helicase PcrA